MLRFLAVGLPEDCGLGLTISLEGGLWELEESLRSRAISHSREALRASRTSMRPRSLDTCASSSATRPSSRRQLGHSAARVSAMTWKDTRSARARASALQQIRERLQIVYEYSHLGGSEILQVRYPEHNRDIYDVIE